MEKVQGSPMVKVSQLVVMEVMLIIIKINSCIMIIIVV